MNGQLRIKQAGTCRCSYVPQCLISATAIPVKIDISSPRSYLLAFPSTKTPTTVIFGNKLSVCVSCPTSIPHAEILAIPPSQTQLQVLPRKIFLMHIRLTHVQQSHGLEQHMYTSQDLQERILNGDGAVTTFIAMKRYLWLGLDY